MILCDTGPLVAIIDERDARHQDCAGALLNLETPLVTTWACLTEAMHLAGGKHGHAGQMALWMMVAREIIRIHVPIDGEWQRMRELMVQYRNVPMALADSSLVVLAEALNLQRIFTLDSDFRIYRLADGRAFEVVPQ
jgi:predicted nucleic acid-binding protein